MVFDRSGCGIVCGAAAERRAFDRSGSLAGTLEGDDVSLGILLCFALQF